MNQVQNELRHYGVLGMKWGKRMATSAAKGLQKDVDSLRSHGYHEEANAIEKMADRKRAKAKELDGKIQAKEERRDKIKAQTRELNKNASIEERIIYNNATRKKAAKYIVDNNMTVEAATKKAKGDAWRNTGIFVAGYGAVTLAALYAQSR